MWPFSSHKSLQLKTARRAHSSFRPRLEALEDRTLLSPYMVTTTADGGPGSLRDAINQINADVNHALYFSPSNPAVDEIDFAVGVATIAPQSALPNITTSVVIDGGGSPNMNSVATNGQSSDTASRPVTLDGAAAGASFDGLTITAGNSTIKGLTIQNFTNDIHLVGAGNDVIAGNYLNSAANGVFVDGVSNNTIGGTAPAARNLLVFATAEIKIQGGGATGNLIEGNYIGTDGSLALYSDNDTFRAGGVVIIDASSNTIGGTAQGSGNVIDGDPNGIIIIANDGAANDNFIQGNYIGTNATGTAFLTDALSVQGVCIAGNANHNTIGGPTGGTTGAGRNVISGFDQNVVIQSFGVGCIGNVVEGNYIGTDATGTYSLNNPAGGDNLGVNTDSDTSTVFGGLTPGSGNLISGNLSGALQLFGTGDVLEGNLIGTDFTGKNPLPNGGGVSEGGVQDVIGGTALGAGNTIAYNQGGGVGVAGTGDRIEGNTVFGNGGLGIILGGGIGAPSLVPNEPGGPFTGPNNSSYSNLTATLSGSEVIVAGTLHGLADTPYFAGFVLNQDGQFPFNDNPITTDASGSANVVADFPADDFPDFTGVVTSLTGIATPPHLGGNYLQNYPVLTAAQSGSDVLVSGTLNGQANTTFTVDVYASPTADPSGYGQGQYYLGYTTVTTDCSGNVSFAADFSAANLPSGVLPGGWAISATATDPDGNTSEFSKDVFASSANALQGALTAAGTVNIQVTTPSQAQAVLAAANSLDPSTTPTSTIVLDLGGQTIQDTIADLPPQVTLTIVNGTFIGGSPALVVKSGQVIIRNSTFSNATDTPTILVTGGSLTLRNDVVQESTGYRDAAISVTGGTVDLGTATDPGGNTFNINGAGAFIQNTTANAIPAIGDAFENNGQATAWPAPLTVTINNSVTLVGNSPPPLTGSVNGTAFTGAITYTTIYGDQVTITLSTKATSTSPVGQYAIIATLSGASAGNYVIDPATSTVGTMYVVSVGADLSSATGAESVAFWDNKGDAKSISAADLSSLDALNLVNQGGAAFDPKAVQQLQAWLSISPNATTAYRLAVDLAVMDLNVLAGNVQATDLVFAGALLPYASADAISGLTSGGFIDVQSLMSAANAVLSQVNPGDPSGDPNQAYEAALAQVLQAADGNTDFVQQEVVWNLFGL